MNVRPRKSSETPLQQRPIFVAERLYGGSHSGVVEYCLARLIYYQTKTLANSVMGLRLWHSTVDMAAYVINGLASSDHLCHQEQVLSNFIDRHLVQRKIPRQK